MHVDGGSRLEQSPHRVARIGLLREHIRPIQEVQHLRSEFQGLSACLINDKGVSERLDLELVIVVEMAKDAPAYLNLEHLYALLLEGHETLLRNAVALLLPALLLDYVFYCADVLARELGLEDAFLEAGQVRVRQTARHFRVQDPEDPQQGFPELLGDFFGGKVVERAKGIEHCSLRGVQNRFHLLVVVGGALDADLNLPVTLDQSLQNIPNRRVFFLLVDGQLYLIAFVSHDNHRDLNGVKSTSLLI